LCPRRIRCIDSLSWSCVRHSSAAAIRWSPGPEARQQNFKRDDYECIRETSQRGAAGLGAIMASNSESQRLYIMCMELRGWTQTDEGVKGGWRPL